MQIPPYNKFLGLLFSFIFVFCQVSFSQESLKKEVEDKIDRKESHYASMARDIWNKAELGYHEYESQSILINALEKEGFSVQKQVSGIPTAFVATFGSGKPVIGLLAEYDALPGLSQDTVPYKKEIVGQHSGHACGHHLLGTASVSAAVEIKNLIENGKLKGTIKVFGTPAEEGGSGKVYMVRSGLFKGVDAVIHWHPDDKNFIMAGTTLANISAKFRFKGVSSHAAISPEKGRSALDGVEAFNYMVNMMREHVPSDTRLHYVITDGGKAPNIVPDFAEVYYYVRNPDQNIVKEVFERIINAAKGAAMGSGTTVDFEILGGVYNTLNNYSIGKVLAHNFGALGGYSLSEDEIAFSRKLEETIIGNKRPLESTQLVDTLINPNFVSYASTDVGDVSWNVPTAGFSTATWVPGVSAHSWQAVASGGMSIGTKGMLLASKVMANTLIDLFKQPNVLEEAKTELSKEQGKDFKYTPLVGDREPPFDYRK